MIALARLTAPLPKTRRVPSSPRARVVPASVRPRSPSASRSAMGKPAVTTAAAVYVAVVQEGRYARGGRATASLPVRFLSTPMPSMRVRIRLSAGTRTAPVAPTRVTAQAVQSTAPGRCRKPLQVINRARFLLMGRVAATSAPRHSPSASPIAAGRTVGETGAVVLAARARAVPFAAPAPVFAPNPAVVSSFRELWRFGVPMVPIVLIAVGPCRERWRAAAVPTWVASRVPCLPRTTAAPLTPARPVHKDGTTGDLHQNQRFGTLIVEPSPVMAGIRFPGLQPVP